MTSLIQDGAEVDFSEVLHEVATAGRSFLLKDADDGTFVAAVIPMSTWEMLMEWKRENGHVDEEAKA